MGLCGSSTAVDVKPKEDKNDSGEDGSTGNHSMRDHAPVLQVDGTVVNVPVFPVKDAGLSLEGLQALLRAAREEVRLLRRPALVIPCARPIFFATHSKTLI